MRSISLQEWKNWADQSHWPGKFPEPAQAAAEGFFTGMLNGKTIGPDCCCSTELSTSGLVRTVTTDRGTAGFLLTMQLRSRKPRPGVPHRTVMAMASG